MLFTAEAVKYALQEIGRRAGLLIESDPFLAFKRIGIRMYYALPDTVEDDQPHIILVPCRGACWDEILNSPAHSLNWFNPSDVTPALKSLPFENRIPVLFWGEGYENGGKPFAEYKANGSIIFYADILAATFFMLSRWEETMSPVLDKHGRFLARESVAYRQGFLDIPVVDQYGLILRAWLQALLPFWQPSRRVFSVKLSHDIDHVRRFNSPNQFLKPLGYELLRNNIKAALEIIETGWKEQAKPEANPNYRGVTRLAAISKQNNMDSAFYFKASKPGPYDSGYKPEWSWVKSLIISLQEQGFEVGFHPGYQTLNDFNTLIQEKKRFDKILGVKKFGGRQHYLRFRVPDTWRFWEEAGFSYDSSMGYPDHEGFRCGTCLPYHPFDLIDDRQLGILEIPLIVMDATLTGYRSMSIEESEQKILELAMRSYEVDGIFTLLWHNTSLEDILWVNAYERVVTKLSAMQKVLPV